MAEKVGHCEGCPIACTASFFISSLEWQIGYVTGENKSAGKGLSDADLKRVHSETYVIFLANCTEEERKPAIEAYFKFVGTFIEQLP